MSVEEAAAALGVSRKHAYSECHRYIDTDGEAGIPCIALGRSLRVPTVAIRRMVGLDVPDLIAS
ncbi:MAG: helix-turn-helix domain-containing protein [Microthrixaceae bacterium]